MTFSNIFAAALSFCFNLDLRTASEIPRCQTGDASLHLATNFPTSSITSSSFSESLHIITTCCDNTSRLGTHIFLLLRLELESSTTLQLLLFLPFPPFPFSPRAAPAVFFLSYPSYYHSCWTPREIVVLLV